MLRLVAEGFTCMPESLDPPFPKVTMPFLEYKPPPVLVIPPFPMIVDTYRVDGMLYPIVGGWPLILLTVKVEIVPTWFSIVETVRLDGITTVPCCVK